MRQIMNFCVCATVSLALIAGCQGTTDSKPQTTAKVDQHEHGDGHVHATETAAKTGHDHSGWWCNEHGVPEGVCALCDSKVAAEMQKAGDWCKEHDRPDSQCFKCHPELEAKFAAQYEAKFGKQPPKPELN